MLDTKYFDKQTVLITGASGFIGSHLCKRLRKIGAVVHGVSRSKREDDSVSCWWQAELDDEVTTKKLIEKVSPDIIFHLSSLVSGRRELSLVLPTLRDNLLSTVNLLVAGTEAKCSKIILTGSLEEAEGASTTVIPSSPYAAAKGAASTYARMFNALYETPVVTARLFMVYGPDQKDLTKLIPYVTLSLLRDEKPKLMSGKREIDWVYVDDVVDAYLSIASASGIEGETVDVGSGELRTVQQVVEQLGGIIAPSISPEFGDLRDRPMERVRVADVEQTFELTGWKPSTSLAQGLQNTVDWYRRHA